MNKTRIIDAHTHIFPSKVAIKATQATGNYYGAQMYGDGTIEDLLNKGKEINVYKYIVHSTATRADQVESINDFIADAQAMNESFIGFGTLHPELTDVKLEINRLITLGLKGIKLHPDFQDFNIDDPSMMPIYEALEGRLPVLMHMGDEKRTSSSPKRLANVLDKFPKLIVIAAHLGGYQMWDDSIKYLVGRNLYLDTSSSLAFLDKEKSTYIIKEHGTNKVLFGTDYPMWSHEEELQRFYSLDLTTEEQEQILWKNASNLLNL